MEKKQKKKQTFLLGLSLIHGVWWELKGGGRRSCGSGTLPKVSLKKQQLNKFSLMDFPWLWIKKQNKIGQWEFIRVFVQLMSFLSHCYMTLFWYCSPCILVSGVAVVCLRLFLIHTARSTLGMTRQRKEDWSFLIELWCVSECHFFDRFIYLIIFSLDPPPIGLLIPLFL